MRDAVGGQSPAGGGGICAIILAAGQSKRMRSDTPKVLHAALGQSLVSYVVQAARAAGAARAVVVVRPEHRSAVEEAIASLAAADFQVTTALQSEARGTAHAVVSARAAVDASASGGAATFTGTALVLLGDAPCVSPDALATLLREHKERAATLSVLTGEVAEPRGYGRIVRGPDKDLAAIVEEKDASPETRAVREINSGVMAFELPAAWATLEKIGPSASGELYLTDAIGLLRGAGKRVHAVRAAHEEDVLGVNDRSQLAQVTAILRRRINERHMREGVTIVDPSSTFIDARAVLEQDVTVEPFSVIEGPVRLERGARVGPFARVRGASRVGPGALVGNFVEVVRSDIGARTRALHHAYLGDATLGPDVNVGAGCVTANFDGERHHRTEIGAGVQLGSDTVIVAPARLAAGCRTGAGAVVVKGEVPAGETWVGVPARAMQRAGGSGR